jgi:hypothetical protein
VSRTSDHGVVIDESPITAQTRPPPKGLPDDRPPKTLKQDLRGDFYCSRDFEAPYPACLGHATRVFRVRDSMPRQWLVATSTVGTNNCCRVLL